MAARRRGALFGDGRSNVSRTSVVTGSGCDPDP